jgi:hypothetical protein
VSYLLQYVRRSSEKARVDERLRLNCFDEFDGGAAVRVFVEDTSKRRSGSPRLKLAISDCSNTIFLEFGVETPELRANSLFKIETLIGALTRFRDGLVAEIDLYQTREGGVRCRT